MKWCSLSVRSSLSVLDSGRCTVNIVKAFRKLILYPVFGQFVEKRWVLPFVRGVTWNLGCGEMYIEGAVNVDSNPAIRADAYSHIGNFLRGALNRNVWVDCIIFSHVLEHLGNANYVLETSAKCLDTGGTICIDLPDYDFQGEKIYMNPDHIWRAQYKKIWDVLRVPEGMRIVKCKRHWWLYSFYIILEKI
jgi:hypothetical protein